MYIYCRPAARLPVSCCCCVCLSAAAANAVPQSPVLGGLQGECGAAASSFDESQGAANVTSQEKTAEEATTPTAKEGSKAADAEDGQEALSPKQANAKGWGKLGSKKKREKHPKDKQGTEPPASPPSGGQTKKKKGFSLFGKKESK